MPMEDDEPGAKEGWRGSGAPYSFYSAFLAVLLEPVEGFRPSLMQLMEYNYATPKKWKDKGSVAAEIHSGWLEMRAVRAYST